MHATGADSGAGTAGIHSPVFPCNEIMQSNPCSFIREGSSTNCRGIKQKLKVFKEPAAAPKGAQATSKAAPTTNRATPAAKKTHDAREDSLLPCCLYLDGNDRFELCGYFTHDPMCKKHIISIKGSEYQNKADVGNACNELVLKGGATKATNQ